MSNRKAPLVIVWTLIFIAAFPFFGFPEDNNPRTFEKEEIKRLNQKLRQATELYYREAYHLALPLFEEIAPKIDTVDVRFRMGRSAFESGESDAAIRQFKTILERNPDLAKARIYLALAYLQAGKARLARRELEKVQLSDIPPDLKDAAAAALRQIDKEERPYYAAFRGSAGVKYADNINSAPGEAEIELYTGDRLTGVKEESGWANVVKANLDIMREGDFIWRNRFNFYHEDYFSHNDFDYQRFDFRTSLEKYKESRRVKLPVGVQVKWSGYDELAKSLYVEPEFEYRLADNVDLNVRYRGEIERYTDEEKNGLQDNVTHSIVLGPLITIEKKHLHIVAGEVGYTDRDADSDIETDYDRYSYKEWEIAPYYFLILNNKMEMFFQPRYAYRDYGGKTPGFEDARRDHRFRALALFSMPFMERFFVSTYASYLINESNIAMYDYDNFTVGLDIGVNFSF